MKTKLKRLALVSAFPAGVTTAFLLATFWFDYNVDASETIGLRLVSMDSLRDELFFHGQSSSGAFDIYGVSLMGRHISVTHSMNSDLHRAFFRIYIGIAKILE
ncbi:hypothetical protein ACFQY0_20840 [Haloferula chungangensis]|uniref:Uncharacterized protein n=1 Tax=Haloferula chungangensis TaxID=1048331 RepID=A0ABW2LB01_9BACT